MENSTEDKRSIHISLPFLLGIGLAALVLLVYSGTLEADFIWGDDKDNIYENPHILTVDAASLKWMFTNYDYARRYMPIGWLGWAINYQLTGLSPAGFHLGNLIFHLLNTVLIFVFLFKLLASKQEPREGLSVGAWVCAALGAALWAVHPLRVEPVAWASGRIYGQATFFLMISWLVYMKWIEVPLGQSRRKGFYVVSVVAFMLSLLTYPIALGGVVVFFFLDWYRHGAGREASIQIGKRWLSYRGCGWWDKVPFVGGAVVVLGLTLWARLDSSAFLAPPTLDEFPLFHRVMQVFYIWGYYLWKPFWPVGLSPFYVNLVDVNPLSWPIVGSLGLVLGITGLVAWKCRSKPVLLWLWATYLVMLVPLMGLTEHQHSPNDRYNYIVDLVLVAVLAGGLKYVWDRVPLRMALANASMLAIAVCAYLNIQQNARWLDTITLNQHMQAQLVGNPARADVMIGLAMTHFDRGELEKAEEIYRQVLVLKPTEPTAHSNLADILAATGRIVEAEKLYKEALRIRPNLRSARQNLGIALAEQGRLEEAVEQFAEMLRYYPDNARTHHNLSLTLAQLGRKEETRKHRNEALKLESGSNSTATPIANSK